MFERVMVPKYQICILKGWAQNSNVNILNELAAESRKVPLSVGIAIFGASRDLKL